MIPLLFPLHPALFHIISVQYMPFLKKLAATTACLMWPCWDYINLVYSPGIPPSSLPRTSPVTLEGWRHMSNCTQFCWLKCILLRTTFKKFLEDRTSKGCRYEKVDRARLQWHCKGSKFEVLGMTLKALRSRTPQIMILLYSPLSLQRSDGTSPFCIPAEDVFLWKIKMAFP